MPIDLQFLASSSPFDITESSSEVLSIKGFASVELPDRDSEIVHPLEFDIATYMISPTLLENHNFLYDQMGNETAAGYVVEAFAAYVSDEQGDYFIVSDLKTGEQKNTILKSRVPRLKVGDRGLFVIANVTHPTTIAKIKRGELGAFSWYGFAHQIEEDGELNRLMAIDLVEISVVNIPAMSQAGFMIGKKLDKSIEFYKQDRNVTICRIGFAKAKYNQDSVDSYLKTRKIKSGSLLENDQFYFAEISDTPKHDISKSFAVTMGNVSVILAPKIEEHEVPAEFVGAISLKEVSKMSKNKAAQRLYFVDEAKIKAHFPKAKIEVQKSAVLDDGTELEIATLEIDEVEQVDVVSETTETENQVEKVQVVETEVAKVETAATTQTQPEQPDYFSVLKAELLELKDLVALLKSEKQKSESEVQVESLKAEIAELAKDAEEKQKRLDSLLKAVSNITPTQPERLETVAKNKSVSDKKSPGDILARLLPF